MTNTPNKPNMYRSMRADSPQARELYRKYIEHILPFSAYMKLLQQLMGADMPSADLPVAQEDAEPKPPVPLPQDEEEDENDLRDSKAAKDTNKLLPWLPADWTEFALLLYITEHETEDRHQSGKADPRVENAMGAATLFADPKNETAYVHYPQMIDAEVSGTHKFLPSLERHAAKAGMKEIMLLVNANKAKSYTEKFGYAPVGKSFVRDGMPLQRMRKSVTSVEPEFDG